MEGLRACGYAACLTAAAALGSGSVRRAVPARGSGRALAGTACLMCAACAAAGLLPESAAAEGAFFVLLSVSVWRGGMYSPAIASGCAALELPSRVSALAGGFAGLAAAAAAELWLAPAPEAERYMRRAAAVIFALCAVASCIWRV